MMYQSYLNRAMKSSDRRYRRIFEKMGYIKPKKKAADKPVIDEAALAALRQEYETVAGERPDLRWGESRLREEVSAAKEAAEDAAGSVPRERPSRFAAPSQVCAPWTETSGRVGATPRHRRLEAARVMGAPTAGTRPVAIPRDLGALLGPPLRDHVQLPHHVYWSGPPVTYDLGERAHRISVYEQLLCEGTDDDIRRYVRIADIVDLWNDLYLPIDVREAWSVQLREQLEMEPAC
jgi:hypothetical protein